MKKALYIILFVYLFFLIGGCESGPYQTIVDENQQSISASCSAWENECNIYCRTNNTTGYRKIEKPEKCEGADTTTSTCIDDEPEKLKLCTEDEKN